MSINENIIFSKYMKKHTDSDSERYPETGDIISVYIL